MAVLIDLHSRAIVGWAMSNRINTELVKAALEMAIERRRPSTGLLVHSDRGSQYASNLYQKTLRKHGFVCSMSRKGDCWDNAPSESFFASIKKEMIFQRSFKVREEAQGAIFEYIEIFYNRVRRHSTIGYMSPFQYESARKIA